MQLFQTDEEWQYVFLITAAVYMAGAIVYGLMASGERQDWSRLDKNADESESYAREDDTFVSETTVSDYGGTTAAK